MNCWTESKKKSCNPLYKGCLGVKRPLAAQASTCSELILLYFFCLSKEKDDEIILICFIIFVDQLSVICLVVSFVLFIRRIGIFIITSPCRLIQDPFKLIKLVINTPG